MDPLTAVAVTAALAECTAARCARRPPAESKEKTSTSSLDDTESEKIPTNPPVTKKLSDAARNRQAYERRMEQRRREEETEPKSKPRKEKAKQKPTPRKSPLSRENPPGPNKPVVLHNDDDMFAIADLLGEPQDHYSGSPQRSDEPKAIPLSNSLEEKTTPPSSLLKEAAESLPSRAPSRRHQGLKPENGGLPNQRPRPKKIDKNILAERPAPSQNTDKQATEIETADKPASIDKPASVNETVEKTTGNGPTHNGNGTASDNNRHSHNNEPVIPHAPGASLTFRDQNIDNLAEKPANMNIDEPATVNETVEKTTGNGPTHNGNKTASDNNCHSHNNEPVLQHAPGAPSTFLSENPKPPYRGRNGQIVSKSTYDEQRANDRMREQAGTTLVGDINQYGISRGLEKIALSPEELNRGRRHRDEKMWEASADAIHVERIFSAETYAFLLRQLAYYFTSDHLVSNAHASELYCRDDGFTIRDLMSWNRMQGITLQELTEFIGAVPGLYFRSNEKDDYMNVNWDYVYDSLISGLSDDLNEMSDDDKKKYLLKNADQDELNEIYWDETITSWNEEKLLDFTVFSRKLIGSEGGDSDGACGIGFASL